MQNVTFFQALESYNDVRRHIMKNGLNIGSQQMYSEAVCTEVYTLRCFVDYHIPSFQIQSERKDAIFLVNKTAHIARDLVAYSVRV